MYTFTSRVRYSETDQKRKMTFTALMNYFQDCSSFQIEHAGAGFDYLDAQHLAWVVNYWQIDVKRLPDFCDPIVIGTNPYDYRGFMGFRNFFMDTEDGERIVIANSIWSLMDLKALLPAEISEDHARRLGAAEPFKMEYTDRKIKIPKGSASKEESSVVVDESMLDSNRHMNNAQYIRVAMMVLNEPEAPGRLRAEYKKQAFLGDRITPVVYSEESGERIVSLNGTDGAPYAIVSYRQMQAWEV